MNLLKAMLTIAVFAFIISGCKKDEAAPATTPPSACNTLSLGGSSVPETAGPGSMGTGAGGTIVDGTYFLTTWYIYPPGSVDPFTRKQTLKISGTTVELLMVKDSDPELRASGTYTVSGSEIIINLTCPSQQQLTGEYTATATEFKMIEASSGSNEVHVYTKQ